MLTMKTKYALKALGYLANAEPGLVLIRDIAEHEAIPKKFLELILRELKQHGLVESRKGRNGGYVLSRAPEDISLAAVIRVLDGPIAPLPCLSQTRYQKCDECQDERTCGLRLALKDAHEATLHALEATTLADVVARSRAARALDARPARFAI
jgi:Rrf2 family protein